MVNTINKIIILILFMVGAAGQTTGKISGKVVDKESGEPIIGANIMLEDTNLGTASDEKGDFFLINIPPGSYNVRFMMIGYETLIMEEVRVSVNRTTPLLVEITQSFLEGAVITVQADKVSVKKDQTNTVKNISSDQIEALPVEDMGAIINMQAGVVAGSFRGGRNTEVTYLVDGVRVDEGFDGTSATVHIEPSTVQDLEVITGTFNAEYGKAMSGVVNQITKDGSDEYHGSISTSYGNYLTPNSDIFIGIDDPALNTNKDIKLQVSGPVIKDKISFFINYRHQKNLNHLNGVEYFNVTDSSNFSADNPLAWYSEHTGDHIIEDYCSDENGVAILNYEGETIGDPVECSNYGICQLQFHACYDTMGNLITITDDIFLCENELGGTWDFYYETIERIDEPLCSAFSAWIQSGPDPEDMPENVQAAFMQSVFMPGIYSVRFENKAYTEMNNSIYTSFMGKLSFFPTSNLRMSFMYTLNDDESHWYSHFYKYNPSGRSANYNTTKFYTWQTNYMISNAMFCDLKLSRIEHDYGSYLYENPLDERYIFDYYYHSESGFLLGGQDKGHTTRKMVDQNLKFDYTWQMNQNHSFKMGFEYLSHDIDNKYYEIRDSTENDNVFTPYIFTGDVISQYKEEYEASAYEHSAYFQDKMEFDRMVINLGLRYDQLDPNRLFPSDYRNPQNALNNVDTSRYEYADIQHQWSPRFGLGYQIGDAAVLHFSYGHFFQMPPLYSLFSNYHWRIPTGDFETILGNPNLNAEKTVSYEIGLWQKLTNSTGLEVNLYYRDIYELLSVKTIETYNTVEYGLYTNKDYGNVRGLEMVLDFRYADFSVLSNYTVQYTRGNADSPQQNYNKDGSHADPVTKLIPMSWDQRHTFNVTLTYNTAVYGVSATAYYNSGTPYNYEPPSTNPLATIYMLPNNEYKPANYTVDATAYYNISIMHILNGRMTLSVYNLFDRLNENNVNNKTGRAYTTIVRDVDVSTFRSNFTDFSDTFQDPSMYSTPRMIKLGLQIDF